MIKYKAPRVWLAPMSGATDAPMRRQAVRFGAPAVVSEMVAGETLAKARPDVVRRTCRHEGAGFWIVQLAARRPGDMLAGAKLMAEAGVDVIDINMGCPSKEVTGGQSGSALMRDLELAGEIIDAAIEGAGARPVTLKMRLGWDDTLRNAPALAQIAERKGVQMLTVHGRTRCQFYAGAADWSAVRETVDAVALPVIVNGDIRDAASAREALRQSGAHGVMIGRAAMGRPWLPGEIAAALDGRRWRMPDMAAQCDSLAEQVADSLALYGSSLGLRMARKHVAAAIDHLALPLPAAERRALRSELCRIEDPAELTRALRAVYLERIPEELV
ncbi:tRNA-dihydrouridine synthase [Hyphomonas sp.]|uniref:tRNA dihydrouridine synthase n=1 Tax=Hyphomonas sp. TaxID=87 RepID=UPI0025C3BC41|nr:tRNA-dihydrouridine synthase [Hyphomonas sp.]